jgi:hypothetical protein
VGAAVRDLLVVAVLDRVINPPVRSPTPPASAGGWRHDGSGRWDEPKDPWAEPDEDGRVRTTSRYDLSEHDGMALQPAVPAATAIAVGVNVGRWWLARHGTLPTAIGFGILATTLGFAGGPFARAALAVLAAASDLLTAESAVARPDPS